MGPNFKVIFAEFKYLQVPWTVHGTHKKKKKGKRAKQCKRVAIQTQPKIIFILLRVFDRRDVFFCIKFLLFPATEF